jgi:hypothetical protein
MGYLAGLVFAVAAFATWAGSSVNRGFSVADRVCSNAGLLCNNAKWLLAAALLLGLIAIYRASVRQQ